MALTVLHIITGLNDGGAEGVLYRLVTARDVTQRSIVVSLGSGGKYGPLLEAHGIVVHYLDMPAGRVTGRGIGFLWKLLRREKPQIVQTWMYHANLFGGILAYLAGSRAIFWNIRHTELVPGTIATTTMFVDWLCARLSRWIPSGIIACAHEAKRIHVANGYDAKKFAIIPNGYDLALFSPDSNSGSLLRNNLGISDTARVIGLVGRWDPQKDHENLLAAVKMTRRYYPDLHLVLAGTDCDRSNQVLASLIKNVGLHQHVHLLGRRSDVPAVMNALDLHVLSSSHGEAFPNVVAEAMACGTPCVVTKVGDAAVIVGDTGWSVPPRHSEALAKAIISALAERESSARWYERQASARQRIIENYSLAVMVARYQKAWGV